MATEFCTVAHNICGSIVWYFFHAIRSAPRGLRGLLDFWEVGRPLFIAFFSSFNFFPPFLYSRHYLVILPSICVISSG